MGADAVTRSLIELKSSEIHKKKQALDRLQRATPDGRVDQVVQAISPLLEDDDQFLVIDAVKSLAVWRSPEAMPALIGRTRDNRHFVRSEAIKALGKYQDLQAAEAIVAVFKEDGFAVEAALKEMGPVAEPAVIPLLRNPDPDLRRKACEVLKYIGGQETLKVMQSLPADPDFGVSVSAKESWKAIVARVGPPPRSSGVRRPARQGLSEVDSSTAPDGSSRPIAARATSNAIEPGEPWSRTHVRWGRAALRSPAWSRSRPMKAWASVC